MNQFLFSKVHDAGVPERCHTDTDTWGILDTRRLDWVNDALDVGDLVNREWYLSQHCGVYINLDKQLSLSNLQLK